MSELSKNWEVWILIPFLLVNYMCWLILDINLMGHGAWICGQRLF